MLPLQRALLIAMMLLCWLSLPNQSIAQTGPTLRPDAARYLDFLNDEQKELNFQLQHGEITRAGYLRASDRINILKGLVSNYGRGTNPAPLPEYHVVPVTELNNIIPDGVTRLKRSRPGQVIDDKWRFLKVIPRSEIFYVLERLSETERSAN